MKRIVIVGAGAAGYAVAEGLHQGGFEGTVTLVGEETDDPYDRPPLSKEVLSGVWEPARAELIAHRRIAPMNPEILTGARAAALDVAGHELTLDDGRTLGYDTVVIATGITPRTLPHPEAPNIRVLRTMQDSLALRALLAEGTPRLVVVGAGFLGLEVAATARGLGADVTVVEPIPGAPLASRIGEVAAHRLQAVHADNGVRIHTGVGVDTITKTGVVRSDGVTHEADVILVAVGSTPTTQWLAGSGLTIDNGLVCDEYCSAGNDVWAAGDVASWFHRGYGQRMRLEHRTNAQEQGHAVAKNILGAAEPFEPVPYFWTDQYKVRVQLAGVIPRDATIDVIEGDAAGEQFVQSYSVHGVVAGVLAWNAPRLLAQHRRALVPTPLR